MLRLILLSYLLATAALAAEPDVLVYGATPAGIAAALAAAADGEKVLLVEKTDRVGGMLTNGLSHGEFRSYEALSGAYRRFAHAVEDYYRPEFGAQTAELTQQGTLAEPKANLAVLEALLAAQPLITVQREWALEAVGTSSEAEGDDAGAMRALEVCLFADAQGERHSVGARFFIDATYEGDLLAAAKLPYRVGREARAEYGEALAPVEPDAELQGYHLHLCLTQEPANRVAVRAPEGYRREEFAEILPLLQAGRLTAAVGADAHCALRTRAPGLPHGKVEIDDLAGGPVRLSLPGSNDGWPDGGGGVALRTGLSPTLEAPPFSRVGLARTRQGIYEEHERWTVGLLYFLQTDTAVPELVRQEAATWGWCRDEFRPTGHVPEQLHVREARRLQGQDLFTANDCATSPGDVRTVLHRDAIAIGDWGLESHGTAQEGGRFAGEQTGAFCQSSAPYQIPYGVLVPRTIENLLVTCAVSSSHVGYCALRYEPVFMALGEAAGHAVHLARAGRTTVQGVPVGRLQNRLHRAGAQTVYLADVPAGSADFMAAQWWGTQGGFRGRKLGAPPAASRTGESRAAYPGHQAELAAPLDGETRRAWAQLAQSLGLEEPVAVTTRGQWVRALWEGSGQPLRDPQD